MQSGGKILRTLKNSFTSPPQLRSFASGSEITRASTTFWAETPLQDLPDTNASLELVRRHNTSFPYLQNQVVVGKVVNVERDHLTIYTGLKSLTKFAKKELHLSQLVRSRDAGVRNGPQDFRVGDVMHFVLEELETPFGDIGLRANKVTDEERVHVLWDELEESFNAKRPVLGRVLNAVNSGYAVGVAGIVAFMPFSMCSVLTASKVGLLQPFLIEMLNRPLKNLIVCDPEVVAQREARQTRLRSRKPVQRQRPQTPNLRQQRSPPAPSQQLDSAQGPYLGKEQFSEVVDKVLSLRGVKYNPRNQLPRPLEYAKRIIEEEERLSGTNVVALYANLERCVSAAQFPEVTAILQKHGFDLEYLREASEKRQREIRGRERSAASKEGRGGSNAQADHQRTQSQERSASQQAN